MVIIVQPWYFSKQMSQYLSYKKVRFILFLNTVKYSRVSVSSSLYSGRDLTFPYTTELLSEIDGVLEGKSLRCYDIKPRQMVT